jgi:hypothetical protein
MSGGERNGPVTFQKIIGSFALVFSQIYFRNGPTLPKNVSLGSIARELKRREESEKNLRKVLI